jgi:hypothetical protein
MKCLALRVARGACFPVMPSEILGRLAERMQDDVDGITLTADALEAVADIRFGEVTIQFDHDEDANSIRVGVAVPPPAGAGRSFLVWCLSINTEYSDVKIGLDEGGELLVHSDVDADKDADLDELARVLVDRAESILELLDEDLIQWLLEQGLGTPAQQERWRSREQPDDEEPEPPG